MKNGAILGLATLMACATMATTAKAGDDLIQRVKQRGTLRVCEISYTPYNVKDPRTNEWSGINVEVVKKIAASLSVKVEDVDSTFSTVIAALQSDKCDISAGATYINPARAEQVLFTIPDAADTKTVVVLNSSSAKSIADLDKAGMVISVLAGSLEESYARGLFKNATVRANTSDATQPHLMEVATHRADAAFAGFTGAYVFSSKNPNLKLKILDDIKLDPSPFALMLPLGEYHFQQYADIVISQMQKRGEMDAIVNQFFPHKAEP